MRSPQVPGPARLPVVRVTEKGATRWRKGHPWIFRSDVRGSSDRAGLVSVEGPNGRYLGQALCSPFSEIRLRLLEPGSDPVDLSWWKERLTACQERRAGIDATAYRLVHAEGDGLPSLIVDRYDRYLVAQLLSAGLEEFRSTVVRALVEVFRPEGILLRNDAPVRRQERLPEEKVLAFGEVPDEVEVREGGVRYLAAPWAGQKTGAFLDQRPNRVLAGNLVPSGGEALDCFTYHGSFALHLAARARHVTAIDSSREALARAERNAGLNGRTNISWEAGDAFELLRSWERARRRFDLIVIDPPAFAKTRSALPQALRGYKEINLRGLRLLRPGGRLVTASCSFHLDRARFFTMLADAAADSGRRCILTHRLGQGIDHPEVITIPETGYLKGAVLEVPA